MDDFLRSELGELPPGIKKAVLKQLENAIRAARAAIYHDKPEDMNQRCLSIVARIANAIDLAAQIRISIKNPQE